MVLVVLVFIFSAAPSGLRSPKDVADFVVVGILTFVSVGVVFRSYISDKSRLTRELEIVRGAYANFARMAQESESIFVWIDETNSWISCNQAALTSIGIARVNSIFDLTHHEEHDVIVQLMHSGSRDSWKAVIDAINIERKRLNNMEGARNEEPPSLILDSVFL